MSTTPDLGQILDITSALNRSMQTRPSADALLEDILPAIVTALPAVQRVCVYRHTSGSLAPWHGDTGGRSFSAEENTPHTQAVRTSSTLQVDTLLLVPLRARGQTLGLLEAELAAETTAPRPTLELIAQHLALALDNHLLMEEMGRWGQRLIAANRAIVTAEDHAEMLQAVLNSGPAYVDMAAALLFDTPLHPGETPQSLRVRAVAYRDRVETPDISDSPGDDPERLQQHLAELFAGEMRVIENIEQYTAAIASGWQHYLLEQKMHSGVTVGIRAGHTLLGLLVVASTQPLPPQRDLDMLHILADQLAIAMENYALLQRTEHSLLEIRTLYEMNSTLLESETALDILRVIQAYIAVDALDISLVEMSYDENDRLKGMTTRCLIDKNGEYEVNTPLYSDLTAEELAGLQEHWEAKGPRLELVEDMARAAEDLPLAERLKARGVASLVIIPVFTHGQRRRQITVTWDKPRSFDTSLHRLFESIQPQINIVLQNQDLLRDMQISADRLSTQVKVLRALNEFATSIGLLQDEETLLKESCQTLQRALGVDHAAIVLLDPNSGLNRVASEHPEAGTVGIEIRASGPIWRALQDSPQRPVVIEDVARAEDIGSELQQVLLKNQVLSTTFVAMTDLQRRVIGLAVLSHSRAGMSLNATVLDTARAVVAQTAISLQKLRLLGRSQRQSEQLQLVANFGRASQATRDIATMFELALDAAVKIVPSDHLSIVFFNRREQQYRAIALHHEGRSSIDPAGGPVVQPEGTVLELVQKTGQYLYVSDMQKEKSAHPFRPEMGSTLVVPLFSRERLVGMVEVSALAPYAYDETDITVFRQLIAQLAVALENAESYVQTERNAQTKALANEITAMLQQQIDFDGLLQVTASELGRALRAHRARIRLGAAAPAAPAASDEDTTS